MFIENVTSKDYYDQLIKNNSLLIDHLQKYCSCEEHATTNLSVPIVFRADTVHCSIPVKSGLSAALQVQFECDQDRGVLPPPKPTSAIMPMSHDYNDPMFDHLITLVQKSLKYHLTQPKYVHNFAANNYMNEWYIFDNKEGNEEFAIKLKLSYDYLKKKNKLSGTFTEWMYVTWHLREHNVKDVRIVFIGGHLATGPHRDTRHLRSTKNSVTLHINAWNSSDYIPGNSSEGPWVPPLDLINWWNTDGFISGKFGELDCWYDKADFRFIFEKELEHVKGKNGIHAFTKEPCKALLQKIQIYNKLDARPDYIIKRNDYKKIVRTHHKNK